MYTKNNQSIEDLARLASDQEREKELLLEDRRCVESRLQIEKKDFQNVLDSFVLACEKAGKVKTSHEPSSGKLRLGDGWMTYEFEAPNHLTLGFIDNPSRSLVYEKYTGTQHDLEIINGQQINSVVWYQKERKQGLMPYTAEVAQKAVERLVRSQK